MYTIKINNVHRTVTINEKEILNGVNENGCLMGYKHTGLGNNLFEISQLLVYCWKNNLKYTIPDIQILYNKLPNYPKNTIYRNLTINNDKNITYIKNSKYEYKSLHKYRSKLLTIFSIDEKSMIYLKNKYLNKFNNDILVSMHVRRGDYVYISKKWNPNYILKEQYYINAYNEIKNKLK